MDRWLEGSTRSLKTRRSGIGRGIALECLDVPPPATIATIEGLPRVARPLAVRRAISERFVKPLRSYCSTRVPRVRADSLDLSAVTSPDLQVLGGAGRGKAPEAGRNPDTTGTRAGATEDGGRARRASGDGRRRRAGGRRGAGEEKTVVLLRLFDEGPDRDVARAFGLSSLVRNGTAPWQRGNSHSNRDSRLGVL